MAGGRGIELLWLALFPACADVLGAEFDDTSGIAAEAGRAEAGSDASTDGDASVGDAAKDVAADVALTYEVDEDAPRSQLEVLGCDSENCGSPFGPVECPVGEVVTGMRISWAGSPETVPSGLSLVCSPVAQDGTLGTPHELTQGVQVAGPVANELSTVDDCDPKTDVVVGIYGTVGDSGSASYVAAVGLRCAKLVDWMAGAGKVEQKPLHGSNPGNPLTSDCKQGAGGSVLRGISGRVGALFDGIVGHCIPVVVTVTPSG